MGDQQLEAFEKPISARLGVVCVLHRQLFDHKPRLQTNIFECHGRKVIRKSNKKTEQIRASPALHVILKRQQVAKLQRLRVVSSFPPGSRIERWESARKWDERYHLSTLDSRSWRKRGHYSQSKAARFNCEINWGYFRLRVSTLTKYNYPKHMVLVSCYTIYAKNLLQKFTTLANLP